MTSTQSMPQSSLTVQTEEDQMEMGTSPYAQVDDIDFDLDDNQDNFVEEHSMSDDATDNLDPMQADNSTANDDDIMYEEHPGDEDFQYQDDFEMNAENQEHIEDNLVHVDDDLQHVSQDAILQPHSSEDEIAPSNLDEEQDVAEVEEPDLVDEEEEDTNTLLNNIPDELDVPIETHTAFDETTTDAALFETSESFTNVQDFAEAAEDETERAGQNYGTPSKDTEQVIEAEHESEQLVDRDLAQVSAEQQEGATTEPEELIEGGTSTSLQDPTTPSLHPCMVEYDGQYFKLLPCQEDEDEPPMLDNTDLALRPINELLKALHEPLGDYLGHDDEVVLDFSSLGLHICEDSKYASELTLAQIIDTYMLLSQNQQLSQIDPLYCRLTHRACLKTQMSYLVSSAREGKTYATIVEEHIGSPELGTGDETETTQYYEAADELNEEGDDHSDDAVEIEESEHDLPAEDQQYDSAEANHIEQFDVDREAEQSNAVADADNKEFDFDNTDDTTTAEIVAPSVDIQARVTEHDATSRPTSHGAEEEEIENTYEEQYRGAEDTEATLEPQELETNFAEEEDLFADDLQDTEDAAIPDPSGGVLPKTQNGQHHETSVPEVEEDELNFDDWENEDEADEKAKATPLTPSKAVHGKRKLAEEDDLEIDLSTPEPKRNRSS